MDTEKAIRVMSGAAVAAGKMLLKMDPESKRSRLESHKDFLTNADLMAEESILRALTAEYPDIPSFSEESGGEDSRTGYLWIIDPVDGTINFFLGDDHWGVSIALAKNGHTIAAVIYLPAKNQLFSASIGFPLPTTLRSGAQFTRSVVNTDFTLTMSQIWVEWGKKKAGRMDHKEVYEIIARLDYHTLYPQIRNCATNTMLMVACGKISGCVLPQPEPFDIAAAGLIVEHAGGKVTDMDGNPWSPFSKSIVASNGIIHSNLLAILQ